MPDPIICPECGGELWNNRKAKTEGRMKSTAPDLACKDKEGCGWKKWPPKQASTAAGPGTPRPAGHSGTWTDLKATYERCVLLARGAWGIPVGTAPSDGICASANTLFIEVNKRGLNVQVPAPKPAPRPEPDFSDFPEELESEPDDLPF